MFFDICHDESVRRLKALYFSRIDVIIKQNFYFV